MMRRPVSAKKMALMSSDLPRENSATKATTSLSLEPLAQRIEVIVRRPLRQIVLGEEFRERVEPLAQRGAPAAEGVETVGE